jgi:pectate lyase
MRGFSRFLLAALLPVWTTFAFGAGSPPAAASPVTVGTLAFPGAAGPAAATPGGRGGQILRVTTLEPTGPGSLLAAIEASGPRIIVFEVGGVIDLGQRTVNIREPYLTIAGQTAPSPGITLVRGGIDIRTHDVVIRHLRVRPGSAGGTPLKGPDFDAISTVAGHDIIVDHCSLTWATDENLSASGPRFTGATLEEWRRGTSYNVTFSNNLIAEGLAHSVHPKGEHSKGSLIHDNTSGILIVGNLYAHNYERSPLFKGGAQGWVVNNLIYDPGPRAMHYNLIAEEWRGHPYVTGEIAAVGNVLRAGPSTPAGLSLFMVGGSGDLDLYLADNVAVDQWGKELPLRGSYTTAPVKVRVLSRSRLPPGLRALPASAVQDAVIKEAGARPWERDAHDVRVVANVIEGRGEIIDHESEVGGYPTVVPTHAPFVEQEWDLLTMERRQP